MFINVINLRSCTIAHCKCIKCFVHLSSNFFPIDRLFKWISHYVYSLYTLKSGEHTSFTKRQVFIMNGFRKIPLGKLPPGKFLPIKLPPGESSPGKSLPRKFPPGIFPPILIIRRYYKRLCFSLNHSLIHKWGKKGVYTPFIPWTKPFNVYRTDGSFLVKFCNIKKVFVETFVTPKYKIWIICACTNCNFSIQLIIYWSSFTRNKLVLYCFSTSWHFQLSTTVCMCSKNYMFFKILENSQENICVSF